MKRNPLIWLLGAWLLTCVAISCDDEDLVDSIELETTQTADASYLDSLQQVINTHIVALRRLANASQLQLDVKSCTSVDGGYLAVFSNGLKVTLATGVLGDASEQSSDYLPTIGIKARGDEFYWTVDDEYLLTQVSSGDRVAVTGDDAETPTVSVSTDEGWQLAYSDTLMALGDASCTCIRSFVEDVDFTDSSAVTFDLADGTSLTFALTGSSTTVQEPLMGSIRRPISPEEPMWLFHICTWTDPDPQKIIDMIPEDILPYVVFNIALSVSGGDTGEWTRVEYGYETAKSWLRTCAENNVWAMIQPSSGGYSHFADLESYDEMLASLYNEFYYDYPNFIGFNYCEQFWGFDATYSVSFETRLAHWTNLMELNHLYGGYLVISCCGPYWAADMNPVAMMKRSSDFAAVCEAYPENLIICEKFTSTYGFFDTESSCLGAWLSGYSGQYGIRYDRCGWSDADGNTDADYPVAAGAIPVAEHVMLTGQTVIDGPETIFDYGYNETSSTTTSDGYTSRQWDFFPQFTNIYIDLFRKILDGTVRIPTREEVIDRTQVVIIQDINSGTNVEKYTSPSSLYDGLYLMDGDGYLRNNNSWFKRTGRYPSIPYVYQLIDDTAQGLTHQVNASSYDAVWGDETTKVAAFDELFPQEYTGDIYAGRHENAWVTYNPYKTGQTATGTIPCQYNTCDSLVLSYSPYSLGIIREYAEKITFYLTNYDDTETSLLSDVIQIYGCTSEPSYTYSDRADHVSSQIKKSWSNGVLTLKVSHRGPLDLTVYYCTGTATDRLTSYTAASLSTPASPQLYYGDRQYEAENFDYKNISKVVTMGYGSGISDYSAMGYLCFGTSSSAAVKTTISVLSAGYYTLSIRYQAPTANVSTVDLWVGGTRIGTPDFAMTGSDTGAWEDATITTYLNAGSTTVELKATGTGASKLYLDRIVVSSQ